MSLTDIHMASKTEWVVDQTEKEAVDDQGFLHQGPDFFLALETVLYTGLFFQLTKTCSKVL